MANKISTSQKRIAEMMEILKITQAEIRHTAILLHFLVILYSRRIARKEIISTEKIFLKNFRYKY